MPKMTKSGPKDLPSTLERSPAKAQRTYAKAHDSAETVRGHKGDEEYANRVAFAAVKRGFEKVGDHWERKAKGARGPSDARAERGGAGPSTGAKGGVDADASKAHLMELAKRLDVAGRSRMRKDELVDAIEKANDRATAKARPMKKNS